MCTRRSRCPLLLKIIGLFLCVFVLSHSGYSDVLSSTRKPYDSIIVSVAQNYRVPPELVHSIIKAESNYDTWAISSKGAMGLMQLMPLTAAQYKVMNVFDPKQNIVGGVKYLVDLIKLYDGDTKHVLAAYNAGQEAIKRYGGIPPYRETRDYIKKVMATYDKPRISTRTKIYAFYDENGRYVLTDNKALWEKNKKKSR
jgi:hypothetical protein